MFCFKILCQFLENLIKNKAQFFSHDVVGDFTLYFKLNYNV